MRITRRSRSAVPYLLAVAALGFTLTGCGDDDTDAAGPGEAGITIADAWARTSPANAEFGAIYMTITADADDALVGALVDTAIAGTTEIHQTAAAEDSEMADGMGSMGMRPVESIDLPAGAAVSLEPGGYHVMLIDLAAPLESGTTVEIDLTFDSGATETVDVPVRDEAP
jgi:periplasmic copper chaperone A